MKDEADMMECLTHHLFLLNLLINQKEHVDIFLSLYFFFNEKKKKILWALIWCKHVDDFVITDMGHFMGQFDVNMWINVSNILRISIPIASFPDLWILQLLGVLVLVGFYRPILSGANYMLPP